MPTMVTDNSRTHDRLTQDIVGKLWNLCNVLKGDGALSERAQLALEQQAGRIHQDWEDGEALWAALG
jgi:hypothetical protein